MNPLAMYPPPFFQWLLHTSWQASILICLILLVQKALGRWIGVRGRYWLWLVVLIRMAMFWAPPSPTSVYNLLPPPQLASYRLPATPQSGNVGPALAATDGTSMTREHGKAGPAANGTRRTLASAGHWLQGWGMAVFLFWLAGACALTGRIGASHIRLWRIIRCEPPAINRRIHRLLRDCRKRMGIKRDVGVIATDRIDSPALFGFVRPRLLLPRQTVTELSPQELRHIFLHELAHLKRHDIIIGYFVTLLHVLHWFNPLIGLGFRRMRADREMVCDALAMSVLAPEETAAYGRTVIHQLQQLQMSRSHWVVAALSGDKARIKQRIAMIGQFRKEKFRWSPLAIVLVGLLAGVGLTNGLAPAHETWDDYARRDFATTHQDKHANIVRASIRHLETGKYLVARGDEVACDANEPGETGLWEARFDEDFAAPDQIVYFYSVAACKYLTSDKEGNLAVSGAEPNEAARWSILNRGGLGGTWIMPRQCKGSYLCLIGQGHVKAAYVKGGGLSYWEIHQVWRVKTSDNPKSNPQWRREHVPGPD